MNIGTSNQGSIEYSHKNTIMTEIPSSATMKKIQWNVPKDKMDYITHGLWQNPKNAEILAILIQEDERDDEYWQ